MTTGNAVVAGSHDSITVVGSAHVLDSNDPDLALVRFTDSGELDGSFADGGKATIDFGNADVAVAATNMGSGRIAVLAHTGRSAPAADAAKTSRRQWSVIVVEHSGRLERGFGKAGVARIPTPGRAVMSSIASDGDGRLLVGGTLTARDDAIVAKLGRGGQLKGGFGAHGHKVIDFEHGEDELAAVSFDQRDRAVIVGSSFTRKKGRGLDEDIVVARLKDDGKRDRSFNGSGKRRFHLIRSHSAATEIDRDAATTVLARNGRILIGGTVSSGGRLDGAVLAVSKHGDYINGFGRRGVRILRPSNPNELKGIPGIAGIVARPGGRTVLAGPVGYGDKQQFTWQLRKDGATDRASQSHGIQTAGLRGRNVLMAADRRGRVLIGGTLDRDHHNTVIFVARFRH